MSADAVAPALPLPELLDAIRAAVAEAAVVPQLLDGTQARNYVGLSRSGWFRALSAGSLPKPVHVAGSGDRWRRADLDKYVANLKPRRKKARGSDGPEI